MTAAVSKLAEHSLVATLHEARQLTVLERAVAIGSEKHARVHRWRVAIQLQHISAHTFIPTKRVSGS